MYLSEKKDVVTIQDLDFAIYLSAQQIQSKIRSVSERLTQDYQDKNPLFLVVLNGAYVFASDLLRNLDFGCEVKFMKISSYKGLSSTGKVSFDNMGDFNIKDRHVVLVEDIVDSGLTLHSLLPELNKQEPLSLEVCTLLSKPSARAFSVSVKYTCFTIPDSFVVGYGLDFDESGRNLPHIYQLIQEIE